MTVPARTVRFGRPIVMGLLMTLLAGLSQPIHAGKGALELRNGYFWDPTAGDYFIARGIAYQTFNPPVGANQSFDQLDYDLLEFKKMGANSVRAEFVWSEIEVGDNVYDWSKSDHLIATAEKLGLKLFVLIGYQYPPKWFNEAHRAVNHFGLTPDVIDRLKVSSPARALDPLSSQARDCLTTNKLIQPHLPAIRSALVAGELPEILAALKTRLPADVFQRVLPCLVSDVLNYNSEEARRAYRDHITEVVTRYRDSKAIGAWILGNECAYFDLWEDNEIFISRRFIGFDRVSIAAYQEFLRQRYGNDISRLNARWKSGWRSFAEVPMPKFYPADRYDPGYHDLLQWRKESVGDFIAEGAKAARAADPNHLLTYSMVGGIFNGSDANNTCEDARSIVARCKAAGVPLDFWSINNYAWATLGSELRSGDYGVTKYQDLLGLPVMLSETGHSSTENLLPGAGPRQPKAIPGQMWEALMCGAVGVHLFHWSDRNMFTTNYFIRERGFGIVNQDRTIKDPVYWNVRNMFQRMAEIRLEALFGGTTNPPTDIQFHWSDASDLVWPRANQENAMIWGALRRLGFHPGLLDDDRFHRREFGAARTLVVSHAPNLEPADLEALNQLVLTGKFNLHAEATPPGQYDTYRQPNSGWTSRMASLFGLDVSSAQLDWSDPVFGRFHETYRRVAFKGPGLGGPMVQDYANTWQIWRGLALGPGGVQWGTQTGLNNSRAAMPGLVVKTHPGGGRTAINTFGLGDTYVTSAFEGGPVPTDDHVWDIRTAWLGAIYTNHFGLQPVIQISGEGSRYVVVDYRRCRNGSLLVSLLNEHTNPARVVLKSAALLAGKTVENLTAGRIVTRQSDGTVSLDLSGDDYFLLHAYDAASPSLVNAAAEKIWLDSPPMSVWPRPEPFEVSAAYDVPAGEVELEVVLESESMPVRVLGRSTRSKVSGTGRGTWQVSVADADLNDPFLRSSRSGGRYAWTVTAYRDGRKLAQSRVPVRVAWGVRPRELPAVVAAGRRYDVTVDWEELPSFLPEEYPTPLGREELWDSLKAGRQFYNIVLELRANGVLVSRQVEVTAAGTGSRTFSVDVPAGAAGPFVWSAHAQTATGVSDDVIDGFEGRDTGADTQLPRGTPGYFAPWTPYHYPGNLNLYFDTGVRPGGSQGSQSAFLVYTNIPVPGVVPGFGIQRSLPRPLALPKDRREWSQYRFSCDVREESGHRMLIDLQLKSPDSPGGIIHLIQYQQAYTNAPGNGWQHVEAPLDWFGTPDGFPFQPLDADNVTVINVNIQMLDPGAVYLVGLDNIRLDGPERIDLSGAVGPVYRSDNDSPPPPADPDTDGDGQTDGQERVAGTNPGDPSSYFRIGSIRTDDSGRTVVGWEGRAGRVYGLSYAEGIEGGGTEFYPVPGLGALVAGADGLMEAVIPAEEPGRPRFYRLSVWQP